MAEPKGRTVGGTECSWCKAVRGGTGIAVLALHTSKQPEPCRLQTALHKLQNSHPILRSRLHYSKATTTFSFLTSPSPFLQLPSHNINDYPDPVVSPLQQILERELNDNAWRDSFNDVFFATVYSMPNDTWVVALRLHVAACDRTTALLLLRELLVLMEENNNKEEGWKGEMSLAIEDMVPHGKAKKAMWARGLDMLGYSLNSLRLTNLKFNDTKTTRFSQVVRLQLNQNDTKGVLAGCKWSGIKLCGALVAAGLMASHCSKRSSNKYGVVTLTDCRSTLESPLSDNFGFYHSAILNSHEIKGGETLWELAKRTYRAFANSKKCNKHFSDMADLNFLMCKAIENPGLTQWSSLRTAIISVFEDTVVDNSIKKQKEVGVEDYMGCASVHGVGPSIAIFDTIRDGSLDCVCVYPAPLHSREQMQEIVNKMKAILIEGAKTYE
ncbi:Chloramphenicol acetyltransferase-like domain superfamily [Sesbania bispinosa]|nr:Chloramphenicol acetyltransferase-like domain superfamily [Sesbania bispinosa]